MIPLNETELPWRQVLPALRREWLPLIAYEAAVSLFAAAVIGPVGLALCYRLIGLWGDGALANRELLEFAVSPLGALALLLAASLAVGWAFVEFAGLIVLADAALRGGSLSHGQLLVRIVGAAPRLFVLAAIQTSLALVVALPFLAAAALTYWLLLADADINYYLAQRPPRFWLALAIGVVLAGGCLACAVWFFVRWALAVPACVLDGCSWLAALRWSSRLMRGRVRRLLCLFVGWQLLKYVVLLAATAGIDQLNHALLAGFAGRLSLLVGSTVALLLVDALGLDLLGGVFAIGMAVLLAREYESARRSCGEPGPAAGAAPSASTPPVRPPWRARAAVVAIALVCPVVSVFGTLLLERGLVEHRGVRVTGHRAGSKAAPENSLAALRSSIAAGADDVEIDVQQTADGQVVLLHDRDLRRVTGDARELHAVNLADLGELRLRDERGPSDERIPTLAELIGACDDRIRINIELKDFAHSARLAPAVVEVLRVGGFTERAVVSSFEMSLLRQIKQAQPELPIGLIISAAQGDVTGLPVDFLSLHQRLVQRGLVRRAHARGKQVHAWTVNDRETALRLLDAGCDNLITSDPALMREVVDWYADLSDAERIVLRLRGWMRR